MMAPLPQPFTVVVISGSIAASNAHGLVNALREQRGEPVVAILSQAAKRFVAIDAVRYAGGAAVVTDESVPFTEQPDHIWLATHMSGLLVYPASANFIARTAAGLASDTASLTFLAGHHRPRMLVPSMNTLMWSNPIVQEAIARHRGYGVEIATTLDGMAPGVSVVVDAFSALMRESAAGAAHRAA